MKTSQSHTACFNKILTSDMPCHNLNHTNYILLSMNAVLVDITSSRHDIGVVLRYELTSQNRAALALGLLHSTLRKPQACEVKYRLYRIKRNINNDTGNNIILGN